MRLRHIPRGSQPPTCPYYRRDLALIVTSGYLCVECTRGVKGEGEGVLERRENRAFLHDATSAIFVFQTNPERIKPCTCVKTFFCS